MERASLGSSSLSLLFLTAVCLLFSTSALFPQSKNSNDDKIVAMVEEEFLAGEAVDRIRHFNGDLTVDERERLEHNLVVLRGDVIVRGTVDGTVVSVYGDVHVESTGSVEGDVIAVDGHISQAAEAWIKGRKIETSPRKLRAEPRRTFEAERQSGHRSWQKRTIFSRPFQFHDRWGWQDHREFIIARYNRVEGAFLGLRWPQGRDYRRAFQRLHIFGQVGFGFENEEWRYQLGGQFSLVEELDLAFGAEYHDFTDTQDSWLLPGGENNLAAALFKRDFFDYYQRKGFSVFGGQNVSRDLTVKLAYRSDQYFSIDNTTNWALFRGGADFRLNPPVEEGRMKSVHVDLILDSRDDPDAPYRGWFVNASAELAGGKFGGDFDFDRYILDIRRYQPIGFDESFDFRIRVGTSRGNVPQQFLFDLGGISTLLGYEFKEFTGNRMLLFNPEYRTDGDNLFGSIWPLEEFNFILFANTGYAWFSGENSSPLDFDNFEFSDLKTDVGFAISNSDCNIRLNVAQRLDDTSRSLNISFRINRHF